MTAAPGSYSLTLHYQNGQTDTFLIHANYTFSNGQTLVQAFNHLLDRDWWTFHLSDRSVTIYTQSIMKVEITPPLPQVQGEGVFSNAAQWTMTTRNARQIAAAEQTSI